MSSETEIIDDIVADASEWSDNNPNGGISYNEDDLLADELRQEELERQEQPISGVVIVYSDPPDRPTTILKAFTTISDANEYIDEKCESSSFESKEHYNTGFALIDWDK